MSGRRGNTFGEHEPASAVCRLSRPGYRLGSSCQGQPRGSGPGVQHKLALPALGRSCDAVAKLLLVTDLPGALADLEDRQLACSTSGCENYLRP